MNNIKFLEDDINDFIKNITHLDTSAYCTLDENYNIHHYIILSYIELK